LPTPRSLITLALSAAALIASGCANAPGVEITNQTGQTIGVTYLDVAPDGSTKIYSSSILAKGGTLTNQADNDQRGFGKRVRFSLPDRTPDDTAGSVELKLSDAAIRTYELKVINGRLVAQEEARSKTLDKRRENRD